MLAEMPEEWFLQVCCFPLCLSAEGTRYPASKIAYSTMQPPATKYGFILLGNLKTTHWSTLDKKDLQKVRFQFEVRALDAGRRHNFRDKNTCACASHIKAQDG
ncbi:hypothetical protein GALMADRAFT_212389 [Galerina marginata CBS 339.88]|uniref:Uncharacterized protein n=1 Tax=Galerina marginata (strain CBS 339.88) TaxID=685588 RepID=A0A067SRF9_GALM3|nr:hypothetical protein GALMADRAFT_212389 [Galerina marginata CBS 339.88]